MALFVTASSSNLLAISLAADGIFALFAPQTRAKLYDKETGTGDSKDLITYINQCQGVVQTGYAATAASLFFGFATNVNTAVGINFLLNSLFNLQILFSNLPKKLGLDVKGEYLNLIINSLSSASLLLFADHPTMQGGKASAIVRFDVMWWSFIGMSLCSRPQILRKAGFRSKDFTSECSDAVKGLGRTMISASIFFGLLTMESVLSSKSEAFTYSMIPLILNGIMKN